MSRKKVTVLFCVLGLLAALPLTFSLCARAGADESAKLSPAGSWVQVDALGNTVFTTIVPLNPSDTRFALVGDDFQGSVDFFGLFPNAVARTKFRGEMIRTGLQAAQATLLAAATDENQDLVYFMVVSGTVHLTGPDSAEATASLGVFGPTQDPFGDAPPEYGCYPYAYTLERVPVSPPCGQ